MNNDLLESSDYGLRGGSDVSTTETTNLLLQALIRETKKTHPSQRCVLQLQYTNPLKILDNGADSCEVKFLASGKPVLGQYLTISNNTGEIVNIGLNEPVSENSAGTFANGIKIAAGGTFQIPVEIEKIFVKLVTAGTGKGIAVGNTPAGTPVNGLVTIYAWTIPNSDKDETE